VFTNATNPYFVGSGTFPGYMPGKGLQNDPDLIRWMYVPVGMRRTSEYDIFDAVLRGDLDYHLWSKDPIQLAVGVQYRELHEISDLTDFADESINPCSTPGLELAGCSQTSPLLFRRGVQISGFVRDYDRRYPVESAFGEIKVPVTDKLNAQVSTRWEKFFSDLGGKDNEVVVAQGALRYQALPWLAFRATAGQTFTQVNPPAPADPIFANPASLPTAQGGSQAGTYTSVNWANTAVKPETGFNYNIGAIFQMGDVTATLDYYDIKIDNVIRAQSSAQILQALTVPGTSGITALVRCDSPLLSQSQDLFNGQPFVITNGGDCVQGTTTFQQLLNGGTVNFFGSQGQQTALVNGGSLETAGVDFNVTWRRADVLGGDLTLGADGTYVLKYEQGDYVINGITVATGYDNGIGLLNAGPGHNGQRVAQFRGSISANFRIGRHNFNWRTSMISSEVNDDPNDFISSNPQNANVPDGNGFVNVAGGSCGALATSPPVPSAAGTGTYGNVGSPGLVIAGLILTGSPVGFNPCQNTAVLSGMKIPASFNSDFSYRLSLPAETSLSVTIQNVFDTDPKFSRDFINYDAFSGSPLGRTVRVGVTKKW
jgi:iron complex outermembrane receptor protein